MFRFIKFQLPICIITCTLCSCLTEQPIDISNFKPKTAKGASYDENFNSGVGLWTLQGFELKEKAGVVGSPALFAQSQSNEMLKASRPIKIVPGGVYDISIKYRTKDITKKQNERRPSFILGYIKPYDKNGNALKGQNFWVKNNFEKGWQQFSSSITIPKEAVEDAELALVFDWWHNGKIWLDDITVQPSGSTSFIYPLEPSNLRLDEDGNIALLAQIPAKEKNDKTEYAILLKTDQESKLLYPANDGVYRGKLNDLSEKKIKINAKLLNMKNKTILAEHDYFLFKPQSKVPNGATQIDKYGRTLRNGKPILPIGTFTYQRMLDADLARVRDAGFDFISFGCRAVNLGGKNSNSKKEMDKMLEELSRYNLKAMLQLTLMIPAKEHIRKKYEPDFDGMNDRETMIAALVKSVKNNPTLLAYYLSDENQRDETIQIQELREMVNEIDPWHLTVTLTNRADNFPYFVPTGDVLCHDNYPLPYSKEVLDADKCLSSMAELKTPIWFCAQGFLWRIISKDKRDDPDPSVGAVRAVPLLAAIYGAKGFLFYSYHEVFVKGPKVDPKHVEEFWPQVVSAVKMLRELEPFILNINTAPDVKVKIQNGQVKTRCMIDADSRIAIPIVAISSGNSSATITPPPGKKYVSRYGLSVEQPDGTWLFTANGIDCDILYSNSER